MDAIAQGAEVLLEPGIVSHGSHVRLDVLLREGDGWAITEVKQSLGKNPANYVDDLAYQTLVAREAGLPIRRAALLCLDPEYRLDGELDPYGLFRELDMTPMVEAALSEVEHARSAIALLPSGPEPKIAPGKHCKDCPFVPHCWVDVPADSLLYLPGVIGKKVVQFTNDGASCILDLDRATLNPRQALTFDALEANRTVASPALAGALAGLRFPAAFVDFEAVSEAVPRVQGFGPFKTLPFQWSCHVVVEPGAEPVHYEWLDATGGDCRAEFVATLARAIQGTESFVHYSKYELTQLSGLAAAEVSGAGALAQEVKDRTFDLESPVKNFVAHPEFHGRSSIKVVLPVLRPGIGYEGLEISSGDAAQAAYVRSVTDPSPQERERLRRALLDYCRMDTLAMVELYRALLELA